MFLKSDTFDKTALTYKDMSDSGAILGWRAESNSKDIVPILSGNMQMFCPSLVMRQLCSHKLKLWHFFHLSEASKLANLPGFDYIGRVVMPV